jgi:hypothetical protein
MENSMNALSASLFCVCLAIAADAQGTSAPADAPQVRPAFSQEQLKPQNAILLEKIEAEKAGSEAQAQREQKLTAETQARGFWADPTTGLMWAAKDNGKSVTWRQAVEYCRSLRLATFSDWRLATLDELASLVIQNDPASEHVGNLEILEINIGHPVKGGLSLTGDPWSSNRNLDRFGHPYGNGYFFDFKTSKPSFDLQDFRNTKYALCVRHPPA